MKTQRLVGPLAAVALAILVGVAAFVSFRGAQSDRARAAVVPVRGLVGSEKAAFFSDPRVIDELRKNGIDVKVDTAGSRDMAFRQDLKTYDFGFPAGAPAAQKLRSAVGAKTAYTPFYTPMAVASWKPIADILVANGIVRRDGQNPIVDMRKLLAVIQSDTRWRDLKSSGAYPVGKSILISSTDVRRSNSGAMYLALASYVLNGDNVVSNEAQARRLAPALAQLFTRQGFQESSSSGPFDDYTQIGMGKAPLVMIYESQFIEYASEHNGTRNGDMVLLYPQPSLYTKHTLVPFDDRGDRLGRLLSDDPALRKLEVEHGFRNADAAYAKEFWSRNAIRVPADLIDVVDPPDYEVLESMITAVDRAYQTPQAQR